MKEIELILKSIKNKELLPIYFLHGEESYYIDLLVKAFENEVLTEEEKAFNQIVIYGKDTNYSEVIALARQFPMMGDRQVIILKEAQEIKLTEKDSETLAQYAKNPLSSTVLVIAHKNKKVDARKSFAKILSKNKMIFLSEQIKDYQLPKFIQDRMNELELKYEPSIPQLLSDHIGNDLSRIDNELHKLKLIVGKEKIIDSEVIETNIGISKDYNIFELQKAIGIKDFEKAMKIAYYIGKNPKSNPFVMMIGNLFSFFSNLVMYHTLKGQSPQEIASVLGISPYFVKDYHLASEKYTLKNCTKIISVLREFDMKSKGLGVNAQSDAELLKELTYKILKVNEY